MVNALPLGGYAALVTSGPTYEPIDPVRFIGNRSSGRQGHAIAQALSRLGATVTLVSGPVAIPDPEGVRVVRVTTAQEMLHACESLLPVDIAVCAAAVADWRVKHAHARKLKKTHAGPPVLELVENPDILLALARRPADRPRLVIGFAAETEALLENAEAKRRRKGCDWIVANDVAKGGVFESAENTITLVTESGAESWEEMPKTQVAARLAERIARHFAGA